MKKLLILSLLAIGGLFFVTGCGENLAEKAVEKSIEAQTGGQVDLEDDGFTLTDEEGNSFTTTTEAELPADYPAAAKYYPGELTGASTLTTPDGKMYVLVIETTDSLTKISDFYNDFLTANNWTDTASLSAANSVIVGGTLDTMSFSAVASSDVEDSNINIISHTITVTE